MRVPLSFQTGNVDGSLIAGVPHREQKVAMRFVCHLHCFAHHLDGKALTTNRR
jgi:hypothetical protein